MAKQNTVFKDAYNRCLQAAGGDILPALRAGTRSGARRQPDDGACHSHAASKRLKLIAWDKRKKIVLRQPQPDDYFPTEETDSLAEIIERSFMRRILAGGAEPGMQINELELAREIGAGTTSVRGVPDPLQPVRADREATEQPLDPQRFHPRVCAGTDRGPRDVRASLGCKFRLRCPTAIRPGRS